VEEVDPYTVYRPPDPHAPLLRASMVTSVDGGAADANGHTAELGGGGDAEVYRTLRALADGILVGAGTVRAEGYGPHRMPARLAERRRADGRDASAPMVLISHSLDLDPGASIFTEAVVPTVVVTCRASPPAQREALSEVARLVVAGDRYVDLTAALRALHDDHGLAHLVCEGGPRLLAALLESDLVDELCVTLAAQLLGASGSELPPGITAGPHPAHPLQLESLCEQDGELYIRYTLGSPGGDRR
jgi:riboflavin biosynthesis pyrimidine reductase